MDAKEWADQLARAAQVSMSELFRVRDELNARWGR